MYAKVQALCFVAIFLVYELENVSIILFIISKESVYFLLLNHILFIGVKAKKGSIVPVCTIGEQERFWLFLVKRQLAKNSYLGTWLNLVEGNKYILCSEDRIEHQSIITRNEKPSFLSSKIKKKELILAETEREEILSIVNSFYV